MKNIGLTEKLNSFKSVRELLKVFSTEKKCENFLKKVRWGNEVISPYDNTAKVYKCSRNRFRCAKTGKDFNVRTGTMFENTKIELRTWLLAIYIITTQLMKLMLEERTKTVIRIKKLKILRAEV